MNTEEVIPMNPKAPKGSKDPVRKTTSPAPLKNDGEPGWAKGLRQLYNSVVEEPLPDSFEDLLKKLDDTKDE